MLMMDATLFSHRTEARALLLHGEWSLRLGEGRLGGRVWRGPWQPCHARMERRSSLKRDVVDALTRERFSR